jgi:alpha-beta hydrolase superfamily lysophospholipase
MGSHLSVNGKDRVWFDPLDIAAAAWQDRLGAARRRGREAVRHVLQRNLRFSRGSHRVERFAYDWRQPLDVLAERLPNSSTACWSETTQPVRLLAHSMGGLVVRACIHKRRR